MDKTSSQRDVLRFGLERAGGFVKMMAQDLTGEQMLHRPCPDANCAAWILGHLTLSNHGGLKSLGKEDDAPALPMPADEFQRRFQRAEGAPEAEEFGDTAQLLDAFDQSLTAYIKAVDEADDDVLDRDFGSDKAPFSSPREMAAFFTIHMASHGGHLSTIRRSLGKPPII